jgi:hypothetical protein
MLGWLDVLYHLTWMLGWLEAYPIEGILNISIP